MITISAQDPVANPQRVESSAIFAGQLFLEGTRSTSRSELLPLGFHYGGTIALPCGSRKVKARPNAF